MPSLTIYPSEYQKFTTQQSKQINVVLLIDGLSFAFGTNFTYTRVRYGDPDIYFGQPGLVYGALKLNQSVKPWLMMGSSLALSQKLEPEQGRASISQFTFQLIDKDGEVSKVVSPGGGYLDEILGRFVQVKVGYVQTSYPEDYWTAFRGMITQVQIVAGRVTLTLGDSNQKKRQATFPKTTTSLSATINNTQTNIPVFSTSDFYDLLSDEGIGNWANWTVQPYIKMQDEWCGYGFGALTATQVTALSRTPTHSRGTIPAAHDIDTEVSTGVQLYDHAITIALKLMLSGWNGPWKTDQTVTALGTTYDPAVTPAANVIVLPPGINADVDLGLVVGDIVTVAGSTAGNNGTYNITAFGNADGFINRLIYINSNLTLENPAPSVTLSFRSKYDVYPVKAGLKMTPNEVDVKTHEYLRDTYFTGGENLFKLFVSGQKVGKEFIEKECYLPLGAYSLTRYGRMSMGFMKPPLASDNLVFLNYGNIIEPETISIVRGLNLRKWFNQIQYEYDATDDGEFQSVQRNIDSESLTKIGMMQLLPIAASGVRGANGGILAQRVARRLLSRFKKGAFDIQLKVFWNPGTFIEVGDVVLLRDDGTLHLTNFETGERDLKEQLYEVTDRTLDIKTGQVRLTLTSGLGTLVTDRYGVISPSSRITATSTTTSQIRIKDSYGNVVNEFEKWTPYIGQEVTIHNDNWTTVGTTTLTGINAGDPYVLTLSPPLAFTPGEDFILDIAAYPTSTDPADGNLYKVLFDHVAPSLTVTSGVSNTSFNVSLSDAAKIPPGAVIYVRNTDFSLFSPEVQVTSVVGTLVTVAEDLGFTPALNQRVELVGFLDGGGPYRML